MPAVLRLTDALVLAQDSAAAGGLRFSWTVTVANFLAAAAVLTSLGAILATRLRDVRLREVEYADKVKTAAASTLARLERAKEISLHFFDVFSRSFVAADHDLSSGTKDRVELKNFVWESAETAVVACNERLLAEQIELAYVEIYVYDREVYALFADARERQKAVWERVIADAKMWTQDDVQHSAPGELRERLRKSVAVLEAELRQDFDDIVNPLRARMERWIAAEAEDIVHRRVPLAGDAAAPLRADFSRLDGVVLRAFARGLHASASEHRKELDRPFGELDRSLSEFASRWPRVLVAMDRLRQRPASPARQDHLAELLRAIRADEQPQVQSAATRLLEVLGGSPGAA